MKLACGRALPFPCIALAFLFFALRNDATHADTVSNGVTLPMLPYGSSALPAHTHTRLRRFCFLSLEKKDSFRNTPLHAAASRRSQLSRHEVPHAHKSRRIRRPPPCLSSPHDADVTHLSSSERSEGKRQKEGPRGVGCDLRPSFPPKVPSSPCVVPPPLTTCHADHRRLCCGALREAQRFTAPPAQEPTIYSSDCAAMLERRVA